MGKGEGGRETNVILSVAREAGEVEGAELRPLASLRVTTPFPLPPSPFPIKPS